jgi:hypothetical protein
VSFGEAPRPAGSVTVTEQGSFHEPLTAAVYDRFWAGFQLAPDAEREYGPLAAHTRPGFSIRTPTFTLQKQRLFALVRGGGMAYTAVAQHAVLAGPLHTRLPQTFQDSEQYRWVELHMGQYLGMRMHVEYTADPKTNFAVAMLVEADTAPPSDPLPPQKLVPRQDEPEALTKVRAAEAELAKNVVWSSRLVLAMWDGPAVDSPVFIRGNPRSTGAIVPHRNLEALAGTEKLSHQHGSGRIELAKQWIDPTQNPLLARVMVNRVWHHLFGRGLVPSTDNFGVLGEKPTHPVLLDDLAQGFIAHRWSIKWLIKTCVLTEAFQRSSSPHPAAVQVDPNNSLLHSYPVRRLDGEAIRDAMLQVSGRLDARLYGPSVPIQLTPFLDGRGRPAVSGPVDGDGRRSLYLAVRRNFLSPFLLAFDTPIPFSTMGRRQVSNVPAQALILLNDPLVHTIAKHWGKAVAEADGTPRERIATMYLQAFSRQATDRELDACEVFLGERTAKAEAWAELAHALLNVKEFIFLR